MLEWFNFASFAIGFIVGAFVLTVAGLTAAHYSEYERRRKDLYQYGSRREHNKKRPK